MIKSILVLAFILAIPSLSAGDGLIFKLPDDGSWVQYSGTLSAEFKSGNTEAWTSVAGSHDVLVSSVGKLDRAGHACRWIELSYRSRLDGQDELVGDHDLRVLVPEKDLARGSDSLSHAILTFWNPKEADEEGLKVEPGFDRFAYERDRFLICFPPPLVEVKQLPPETIETPITTYDDCEVVSGKVHFDRPTRDMGRWEVTTRWKIALHKDAPFGVVRLESESDGVEISAGGGIVNVRGKMNLQVSEAGSNAMSRLAENGQLKE